ncbi:MAG TPA: FAD-dependent oxidoreductase, partial [Terriglobales bacterium]|nr:FAD-dependent oxidoreductase [Terriglobales bacterium]
MPVYQSKLISREQIAEGTMAFHFEKPAGFDFQGGQSVDLTMLNPPETDEEGNIRTFSIVSAPHEKELMFATRMRDTAFKRSLKTIPLGTELKIDGPMGSFTLHKNSTKPAAFLAGGIGITPFMSIVSQAAHDRLPHPLYLFYSNHRPEDAPFLDFLRRLEQDNPNYHFIPTMTQMDKSKRPWNGERGYVDSAMLIKYL